MRGRIRYGAAGSMNRWIACIAVFLAIIPSPVRAQGVGTTGAQVLQFVAGSRASAMAGAYTAADGDADALFYNPAGIVTMRMGGALSYETYVEQIALGSFGGVVRVGRFSVGLGGVYLNGGDVIEVVPDPAFGGNRGIPTN